MPNHSPNVNCGSLFVGLALALGGFSVAYGAALDVGGAGPFHSVQQAVDAAQPGDVVRVAAGTYMESVVLQKSLSILGGFDPDHIAQNPTSYPTRILAQATSQTAILMRAAGVWLLSGKVIAAPRVGWLLVQGQTIRRIESVSPATGAWQIGLDRDEGLTTGPAALLAPRDVVFYITDSGDTAPRPANAAPMRIQLDSLIIAGGRADRSAGAAANSGGGIHLDCRRRTSFSLTRCELTYNSAARDGGGAWIAISDLTECRITSSAITRNACFGSTASAGGGLAIRLARGAEFFASKNRIADNRSSGHAGGMSLEAASGCYARLDENVIASNTAQQDAGGLAVRLALFSLLESRGDGLEGNQAAAGSCGGGSVEVWGESRVWLVNDRILSNRAAWVCGGLDVWAERESWCELSGLRVRNNEAMECGGLNLAALSASALTLSHSDIASNRAMAGDTGGLFGKADEGSVIEMTTVTVAANIAARDCGGFDLVVQSSSSLALVGCDVSQNVAVGACGGGRLTGKEYAIVEWLGSRFADNGAVAGANGVGAFDFVDHSHLRFSQCDILGNRSRTDSGVGSFSLAQGSSADLIECRLHDNATSGSGGIGFVQAVEGSSMELRRCDVVQNESANGSHGALCLEGYFGSRLTFVETVFEENESGGPAGALYVYADEQTSVAMAQCRFLRNRAWGGRYGACAIEAQRDSPVLIRSTTIAENEADGDHSGLFVSVTEGSPLVIFDCRIHQNVASYGNSGALTIFAENECPVSLTATHCWANRAYGDAGAVWIVARQDCPLVIEDCDWYGNLAWHERTERVVLEAADEHWRIAPSAGAIPQLPLRFELGDLITQGSLSWAVSGIASEATSTLVLLTGPAAAAPPPKAGPALLRKVGGNAGAFLLDQQDGGGCLVLRLRLWQNRAGRDYGAGTMSILDSPAVQVRECSFSENIAGRDGGAAGLWFAHIDRVNVERNAFVDNRAGSREDIATGGFCGGLDLYASDLRLLFFGNSLRGNQASRCGTSGGNWGGGLLEIEEISVAEFLQNEIRSNQADSDVGGIEITCRDLSSAIARDNLVANNRAGRDFGGFVAGAGLLSPITVELNEFRSNHAGVCGGGLALRSCESSNGYLVTRNQFARNAAPAGGAILVLGPATLQNNLLAGNLGNRVGAITVVATNVTLANNTVADNPGVALAAIGGAIHLPSRMAWRGHPARETVEIEAASPSLVALLLCARHLPVYLIGPTLQSASATTPGLSSQHQTAYRIRDLQFNPTANAAWVAWRLSGQTGVRPIAPPMSDIPTLAACEIATEAQWPATLEKAPQGWRLVTTSGQSPLTPARGQHVTQGDADRLIVEVRGRAPSYLLTLDNDGNLGDGDATVIAPPPAAASLVVRNSIIWGSEQAVLSLGGPKIEVAYSNLAGGGRPGQGNMDSDPRFIAPPRDYRLAPQSPAIDVGTSVGVPRIDLTGAPRPLDGNGDGVAAWDLGAYEMRSQK